MALGQRTYERPDAADFGHTQRRDHHDHNEQEDELHHVEDRNRPHAAQKRIDQCDQPDDDDQDINRERNLHGEELA